ncbi:MAG: hypothetical protein JST68_15385 [Bacteroidetes bacterium]|nr:hypothetical protein [Bacteroidota bacterium]
MATPDCEGIIYHFGYNPETALLPQRYEAVMEAVDKNKQSLHAFIEQGQLCPPNCPPTGPTGPFFKIDQLPQGALYEMFHNVSPSLLEVIQDKKIFQQHFSECNALAEAGNLPEARQSLKNHLENLIEKYLFSN